MKGLGALADARDHVWQLKVFLYEGHPVTLGFYRSKEAAEAAWVEEREEWDGPNVSDRRILRHKVLG